MKDLGDRSSPTGLGFLGSCYVHFCFPTLPSLCMVRGEWLHERVGGSGTWFAIAKVCGSILRGWSMCNLEVLKHSLLFGVVDNLPVLLCCCGSHSSFVYQPLSQAHDSTTANPINCVCIVNFIPLHHRNPIFIADDKRLILPHTMSSFPDSLSPISHAVIKTHA